MTPLRHGPIARQPPWPRSARRSWGYRYGWSNSTCALAAVLAAALAVNLVYCYNLMMRALLLSSGSGASRPFTPEELARGPHAQVWDSDSSENKNIDLQQASDQHYMYGSHVDELVENAEPAYRDVCRRMLLGEPLTFAQGYQDWYMAHNLKDYKYRQWGDGWYLDIGTNHPTAISNTLFFDKCLGWQGICIEPNPLYHEGIRRERSCQLVPHCVLGTTKNVTTVGDGALLSVKGGMDSNDPTLEAKQCRGILDVIRNLDTLPTSIDIASIDIEGAEGDVLRCFPFDQISVDHWLVETNKQPQVSVDWFFHRHGYGAVTTFGDSTNGGYFLDTLYARKSRKEALPAANGGKMLSVQTDGASTSNIVEIPGHDFFLWPGNKRPVANSDRGPGSGEDWLECKE
mmetsp:Transcript_23484/g.52036  ORF Transcript_23484/g.52036 Transcript_23484/m.52036 type:complete len:401 (+) Transcript_23484:69-1271(+)